SFIPQGGGNAYETHRCPGENVALALMESAAVFLTEHMQYDVPEQDLDTDYQRLPALPKSHFIISNVRLLN
ncbi:MAG: cytochrome P450, partial [Anaerolineae bacterium]|nr:cytochrome P450 [Anaerolineae bacterium]